MKQPVVWAAAALIIGSAAAYGIHATSDGCPVYIPASGVLVAHAGGGLPDRTYANNLEALDLAARHGFRFVELDFRERDRTLLLGHDDRHQSTLTLAGLMAWLDRHPSISVITDIKTDNMSGLVILKRAAGNRQDRLIPQIYQPGQLTPARNLGYRRIIFAERIGESRNWYPWVNSVDLFAVTLQPRRGLKIAHPVFLYTVNEPMDAYGLYTDCLVPTPAATQSS